LIKRLLREVGSKNFGLGFLFRLAVFDEEKIKKSYLVDFETQIPLDKIQNNTN
jgi:hypothetical protein